MGRSGRLPLGAVAVEKEAECGHAQGRGAVEEISVAGQEEVAGSNQQDRVEEALVRQGERRPDSKRAKRSRSVPGDRGRTLQGIWLASWLTTNCRLLTARPEPDLPSDGSTPTRISSCRGLLKWTNWRIRRS